ncbi:MAG: hypothetical protein ACM3ZB_16250 [bacterium]|jgi:hypothetical protein
MSSVIKVILAILLAVILLPLALKIFFSLLAWTIKLGILALIVIGLVTVISHLFRHA